MISAIQKIRAINTTDAYASPNSNVVSNLDEHIASREEGEWFCVHQSDPKLLIVISSGLSPNFPSHCSFPYL
jgi:hypothetical protein